MLEELNKKLSDMTKAELLAYIEAQQAKEKELEAKLEELKTKKVDDIQEPVNTTPRNIQDWLNERVPFFAFKDNDKYKDDIVVGVNGKTFIIQRGVEVMIPRYVKMVLEDSMIQDVHAANVIESFEEQHRRRARELGIER